jgi:anti-anti-sigma factor
MEEEMQATSSSKRGHAQTVRVAGEMTIYRAAELKHALLRAIDESAAVDVELSGVTEIDSAGVQLLVITMRTAVESGCDLRLTAASQAVLEVLDLLGLRSYFNQPLPAMPVSVA